MPVRYNRNPSGFSPPMRDNMDNCACICDDACCHENGMENDLDDENHSTVITSTRNANVVKQKIKKSTLFCPPPLIHSSQLGVTNSLLYSGSKFGGFQKSKGNSYEVEVIFQVIVLYILNPN